MVATESQAALSEAPDGQLQRSQSGAEPMQEGSANLLGTVQPSLQRNMSGAALRHSRRESMAVSLDQVLSEPQASGFAAAIETVRPLSSLLHRYPSRSL